MTSFCQKKVICISHQNCHFLLPPNTLQPFSHFIYFHWKMILSMKLFLCSDTMHHTFFFRTCVTRGDKKMEQITLALDVWGLIVKRQDSVLSNMRLFQTCWLFYKELSLSLESFEPLDHILTNEIVSKYRGLTRLDLSNNERIHDDTLMKLKDLKILYLDNVKSNEKRSPVTSKGVNSLSQLMKLSLIHNPWIEISGHEKLLSLNMSSTKIDTINPQSLEKYTNLTELNASYNRSVKIGRISMLMNLTSLNMTFTFVSVEEVSMLTNLTNLEIGFIPLENSLRNLHLLKRLDLYRCRIDPEYLRHLTNLTSLNMPHCYDYYELTNDVLSGFTQLTYLNISGSRLVSDDSLMKLTQLRKLKIYGTEGKITCNGLMTLPNLTTIDLCKDQLNQEFINPPQAIFEKIINTSARNYFEFTDKK